jgi:hypothetical protein
MLTPGEIGVLVDLYAATTKAVLLLVEWEQRDEVLSLLISALRDQGEFSCDFSEDDELSQQP